LRSEPKGWRRQDHHQVNLAAGLAKLDQRVLLVDLDPQGNATMGAGINKAGLAGIDL
jgi:cellulose biosynthesis protein BcsQ